jgi:hypothetical protein
MKQSRISVSYRKPVNETCFQAAERIKQVSIISCWFVVIRGGNKDSRRFPYSLSFYSNLWTQLEGELNQLKNHPIKKMTFNVIDILKTHFFNQF